MQVKYSVAAIQAKPIEVILTQPYIKLGLGSATTTQALECSSDLDVNLTITDLKIEVSQESLIVLQCDRIHHHRGHWTF